MACISNEEGFLCQLCTVWDTKMFTVWTKGRYPVSDLVDTYVFLCASSCRTAVRGGAELLAEWGRDWAAEGCGASWAWGNWKQPSGSLPGPAACHSLPRHPTGTKCAGTLKQCQVRGTTCSHKLGTFQVFNLWTWLSRIDLIKYTCGLHCNDATFQQ